MANYLREAVNSGMPLGPPSPADWLMALGPGQVVVTDDGNTSVTLNLQTGDVVRGPFRKLTSTTITAGVRYGTGVPPSAGPPSQSATGSMLSSAVTPFTAKTTADGALAEIYQSLETTQGLLPIDICNGILAAGTPLAAFADSASSAPGVTLDNSKAVCVRWNDAATQVAVWAPQIPIPLDMDVTKAATFVVLASKSGATVGDATTFDIACFQQSIAALEDAGSNLGGTTGALTGNATAKTVQKVTFAIAANTFAAPPGSLSVSIKPTNGTLGTDDCVINGFYLQYQKKLLTS